jgi:hypothetical protein
MSLNFVQHRLFKFVLIEQQGLTGFTTALQICAASMVVMFAGFGSGIRVVVATKSQTTRRIKRYSVR